MLLGDQRFELATRRRRLAARGLDVVIYAFGCAIGALIATSATRDMDTSSSTAGIGVGLAILLFAWLFLVVLVFVNEFWLVARSGKSLGKAAMSIRVSRADTGDAPGWGRSLGRGAFPLGVLLIPPVAIYVALVLFVGSKVWWAVIVALLATPYVPIIWDPARRGLHDRMASTIVVRAR